MMFIGNNDDSPSNHRPQLALLAMDVIAQWSILESGLRSLFVSMLGANPTPAAAMYSSLTSTVAQRDAIMAVAETVLEAKEMKLFEAIMALFMSAAKERNKIAHWVWGWDANLKDAVLLCDPQVLMDFNLALEAHKERTFEVFSDPERRKAGPPASPSFPHDKVFVYREADFKTTASKIQSLILHVGKFAFIANKGHPANRGGRVYDSLSAEPEIREVLDRPLKHRKTTPEAPRPKPQRPDHA